MTPPPKPASEPSHAELQDVAGGSLAVAEAKGSLRILMLEDSRFDADLEIGTLEDAGFRCECERVDSRSAFEAELGNPDYDVVLADHNLPNFDGLTALQLFRERHLEIPFIFVSGTLGEERAIESLRAGATDYVLKTHLARLAPVVTRALREQAEHRRRQQAEAARQEEATIAAALARVGRALIASLDTPELIKRLCELSTDVLDAHYSHTLLQEGDEGDFGTLQGHGNTHERWEVLQAMRLPPALLEPMFKALQEQSLIVVTPGEVDSPARALRDAHGLTNGVYAALRRGAETIGLLAVGRNDATPFSASQLRLAEGIAQLASLALSNARAVEELARVSALKSDFVATMSHELRTPLNVILGYNDLLIDGEFGSVTAEQTEVLRRMWNSARHLLDLVNATLDLGRLETGRLPLLTGEVLLPSLISEVEAELQPQFAAKPGVRLETEVAQDLPVVRSDAAKLRIVLKNVLDNAVKFSDAGVIALRVAPSAGGIELCVTDPGVGIAPHVMPIMFEPFRQGEATNTRRFGGVGLGLYIVRRLLDVLGGRVTVESRVGLGTTVRVWIPIDVD